MYSEKTIIVDVIETGESEYTLSMKASDLYEAAQAGDVLRRNDVGSVAAPEKKYTVLSGVKLASGTYTFTFANGDAFTASSADAYPTAASISNDYAAGGGGSGGVLIVTDTDGTLDKTWQEIHDAMLLGVVVVVSENVLMLANSCNGGGGGYDVSCGGDSAQTTYFASSASDYPVAG